MNGLHELQRDFTRSVLQGEATIADRIRPNGLTTAQRLAVYRNNTFLGLAEALRDGYPVVNRLVGDGFFNGLARAYVAHHPPQSGCLLEYGDRFPAFAAEYPPAQWLPYLPDVARLEWLWQVAFHEADADGLDLSALAAVPAERHGELRLRPHPTARLMASDYPVLRIWEANQEGFAGDDCINLQDGGCRLLLFRPGLDVEIHALDAGDHAFLTALSEDATLTEALEQALIADGRFDLPASLGRWIGLGLFTHCYY
jgi:hypothetical protein